jgi:hypothetical protein
MLLSEACSLPGSLSAWYYAPKSGRAPEVIVGPRLLVLRSSEAAFAEEFDEAMDDGARLGQDQAIAVLVDDLDDRALAWRCSSASGTRIEARTHRARGYV